MSASQAESRAFQVTAETLESLEWSRLADRLRNACRTPVGALRIHGDARPLFEPTEEGVRARQQETREARRLLEIETGPPISGCVDLRERLGLAAKGSVLETSELLDVRRALEAFAETRQFFDRRRDETPALAGIASDIEPLPALERRIARDIDPDGSVRDAASPALAEARRDAGRLASKLQSRIERSLRQESVSPHLSDAYYTVRNGRFVLPVKADARGQVRGIVHDASRSGTTIFVEPEAMIELNNRHRQAELAIEREELRVIRELSAEVSNEADAILRAQEAIGRIDLAVARGRVAVEMDATEPEIGSDGIFELPALRHPLIPVDQCVSNDLRVGRDFGVLLLSGPNAGGKTVALKSIALAALMARAGLQVPAGPGARVDLVTRVLTDIGDHQNIQESLSTFSAAMANLARILRTAGRDTLVCLDEIGVGTDPSEGAAIAQSSLEALAEVGARVVTTTHYNLLKEMAEVDPRFENASVEFDPETLAPTYRVRIGAPGASSATTVAERMGMPRGVLDRATALLDHEDRRLDRMLAELSASRAQLEQEQQRAAALRMESEQARETYREKLARLHERRDRLFDEMKSELDASFRSAHAEVARLIAELQRAPSSRRAATVRERLEEVRSETRREQEASGWGPMPGPEASASAPARPLDWAKAQVGDAVRTPGGGRGTLLALPDRRGQVAVRVGAARVLIDRSALTIDPEAGGRDDRVTATFSPSPLGGLAECDLRGLRVDEALDRLDEAIDAAIGEGRDELRVIHGIGTGALRRAVRDRLADSRFVSGYLEAEREDGGPGATRALIGKDEA